MSTCNLSAERIGAKHVSPVNKQKFFCYC